MGSGKDYIGQQLMDAFGYQKLCFADALKNEICQKHGITRKDLNDNKKDYRTEMQELGQSCREKDSEYWVNKWLSDRDKINGRVVCTDCRYLNEARLGLSMPEAFVIHVCVPEDVRRERLSNLYGKVTKEQLSHESELEIDFVPFHYYMSGQIDSIGISRSFISGYNNWLDSARPVIEKCV